MEGYVRQSGQPGIRNTVQVIFMVECASHVAKEIARAFSCHDVQYFGFSGCYPSDYGYRLVKNLATHSNVGGVLLISLGCENFDRRRLEQEIMESGRPCHTLVIQENKGTSNTITLGKQRVTEMLEQLAHTPRCALNWRALFAGGLMAPVVSRAIRL
ncbi:UxaA family hydrolase [Escherichia albertii]|uniref:UxaA family hydrolase n=1 Tax=Escherichia albertii TaxID=208962 RepID=UPI003081AC57